VSPSTSPSRAFPEAPSVAPMKEFLARALPGTSAGIIELRRQIIEFVTNPTAKAVLLLGAIGTGKSTLARLIALLKRVAPLSEQEAREMLSRVPKAGPNQIDVLFLTSWYVELALTGLVETLADSQLFGSTKGGFSDAQDRAGVFESASRGRMPKSREPALGAQVTGGVVFLDEIGDLSPALQAKLLPVLSGGTFYRVGDEGKESLRFDGVTITASWRNLESRLRPDLLSRIAHYVIYVPGIDDRIEDFELLLNELEAALIESSRKRIKDLLIDPSTDRDYWRRRMGSLVGLDAGTRKYLKTVKWGPLGNLRGLAAAVERVLATNADPRVVVSSLPVISAEEGATKDGGLISRLLDGGSTGSGLAAHLRAIELQQRREFRERVQASPILLARIATALGLDESKVRSQLRNIDRERRS
jgi:DNA-binding NtrC family response regulator